MEPCIIFDHFLHFTVINNMQPKLWFTPECLLINSFLCFFICKPLLCSVSCLQQIDYLISQYATAKNKVVYDLDSK